MDTKRCGMGADHPPHRYDSEGKTFKCMGGPIEPPKNPTGEKSEETPPEFEGKYNFVLSNGAFGIRTVEEVVYDRVGNVRYFVLGDGDILPWAGIVRISKIPKGTL